MRRLRKRLPARVATALLVAACLAAPSALAHEVTTDPAALVQALGRIGLLSEPPVPARVQGLAEAGPGLRARVVMEPPGGRVEIEVYAAPGAAGQRFTRRFRALSAEGRLTLRETWPDPATGGTGIHVVCEAPGGGQRCAAWAEHAPAIATAVLPAGDAGAALALLRDALRSLEVAAALAAPGDFAPVSP